jgi:hypothetical protein
MPGPVLLLALQKLIERTYDLDTGISDLTPFLIGDRGFRKFYGQDEIVQKVDSAAPSHARTLLRHCDGALRLSIYYPDSLVENLERFDPATGIQEKNIDDFATLIEELDHFLTIADRHRGGAEMSLLELELHANITKALTLELFIARMRRDGPLKDEDRLWVRHHLFEKGEFSEDDPDVAVRYRDASSLAVRYLDYLITLQRSERVRELRRFHRRTHHEKLAFIFKL